MKEKFGAGRLRTRSQDESAKGNLNICTTAARKVRLFCSWFEQLSGCEQRKGSGGAFFPPAGRSRTGCFWQSWELWVALSLPYSMSSQTCLPYSVLGSLLQLVPIQVFPGMKPFQAIFLLTFLEIPACLGNISFLVMLFRADCGAYRGSQPLSLPLVISSLAPVCTCKRQSHASVLCDSTHSNCRLETGATPN